MMKKKSRFKKCKNSSLLSPRKILAFFNDHADYTYTIRQLNKHFQAHTKQKKKILYDVIQTLATRKMICKLSEKLYQGLLSKQIHRGVIDFVNPRYAYVIVEEFEQDIWVHVNDMATALDGDVVLLEIFFNPSRTCCKGRVVEIIQRNKTQFIGTLALTRHLAFVVVSGRKMHHDIFVPLNSLQGAKHAQKVIVQLTHWKLQAKNPSGKIIKLLGKSGRHETEIHAIMFEYGLPFEFPETVESEVTKMPVKISEREISRRKDCRDIPTFTIDPEDAKDFDDALSVCKTPQGYWEIGIHIADVSHYVHPNTALEKEAYRRATSVYLVDRTIPMLPEKIANELCSLRPNEDKLTFSVIFQVDESANILKQWFGRTVIHSDRQFTYEQAQENIQADSGSFYEELQVLNRLAKQLKAKRFKDGSINFESTELKFKLDENGKPLQVLPKTRKDTHKMIEEWMLLANRCVAEFMRAENSEVNKMMVYRIHEPPDPKKVQEFAFYLKTLGYTIDTNNLSASLQALHQQLEGNPLQAIIDQQAIRIMSKARYTTASLGHYGLAFKYYTHFTSPIRRYPDLMVHRLLAHKLSQGRSLDKSQYEVCCEHSSKRERMAIEAERASVKYKQVEFIRQFVGKTLSGVVSAITQWGMYVTIDEILCEGLIRLSTMKDDYYYYNELKKQIIGSHYQKVFRLGDPVAVSLLATDLNRRTIDFELL